MFVRRTAAMGMRDAVFCAAFLVYAGVWIDPRLIFHYQGPVFTTIPGFAADFLRYSGGPADYLYQLLAQSYASQWWGAAALTAQLAATLALTGMYLTILGGDALRWLRFLPALLLAWRFGLYYDSTPTALSLLLGLSMSVALVHLSRRWRSDWALAATSVAMLAACCYLGGRALIFFAPMATAALLARRRLPPWWLLPLLFAAALCALPGRAWFAIADPARIIADWGLYLFYAATAVLLIRPRPAPKRRHTETWATAAALLCLGCIGIASWRVNSRDRSLTALDYETSRENWAAVVETARTLPTADFNSLTRYEVNLALHESHRLGDEMFRFPQKGSLLLPLRADPFLPYMIRLTDMCLRLGRINEAERFGSEAMLLRQHDPRVYRQMAAVHMLKGHTEAARKFLNILSFDAGSGAWAREQLDGLERNSTFAAGTHLQLLRQRILRTDDVFPVWQRPDNPSADGDRLLLDQLNQDPGNRMAFEFLMGNYLLARDMLAVHALMPRIAAMTGPAYVRPDGSRRTPRHYQEAMAIYANTAGPQPPMQGLIIEEETEQRFQRFKNTVRQYVTRESAMQSVWNEFRESYFFYFTFGPGDYR
jgi:hypothetical protein